MKAWLITTPALLIVATSNASSVAEVVPAWQAPDFVMEEVVVTATRPAWLSADFVMEEVVATATAEDVAAARAEEQQRQARLELALVADAMASE